MFPFEQKRIPKIFMGVAVVLMLWLVVCSAWITTTSEALMSRSVCYAPEQLFGEVFNKLCDKKPRQAVTFICATASTYSVSERP